MTEPTPPDDDAEVPDRVLDELKLVFADPEAEPEAGPEPTLPAEQLVAEPDDPEPDDLEPDDLEPDDLEPDELEPDDPDDDELDGADDPDDDGAAKARTTIVIGGDDSLPDAVYLDEGDLDGALGAPESDQATGRSTIVIGDELDSTGAFDAVEVPSRSMDPRVRARRVAVKRARGRKRLLWAGAGVLVLLIGVAVLAVFSSSLFAVERVDVQGATNTQHYDPDQLQAIIDDLKGRPVLLVDTLSFERQLEAIPWIERAFVKTDFPNRVFIDIRERRPLATFAGSDQRYRVIDRDGRVVAVLDGRPTDYMLLTGPAPDADAGSLAGAPFAAAAQMVSALPAEIRSLTVSASVDATTGDLGLMMMAPPPVADPATGDTVPPADPEAAPSDQDPIEVRIGSSTNLDSKLARLLQLIRDGLDGAVRIDVSTNEVSVTKGP